MNINEIIKDALKYPFSDWKKILILGIILLISSTVIDNILNLTNIVEMGLLGIIGLLFGLLAYGYAFRIIKSSFVNRMELPAFDDWAKMLMTGFKVLIVGIIFLIPVILVLIFSAIFFPAVFTLTYGSTGLTVFSIFLEVLDSVIVQGIGNIVPILFNISLTTIWGYIAILYMVLITPILLIAIANMAKNDGKLDAAFKFHEIFYKLKCIKWESLIGWYILSGILYLIILVLSNMLPMGLELMILIGIPYFYMYLARSVALLYISE